MKARYKLACDGTMALLRLPYPQTPESAHQWLIDHGVNVSELSRQHRVPRHTLVDLLRGDGEGRRGAAHRGAIVLGLKPEPSK